MVSATSTQLGMYLESRHRQYVNEWEQLCSNQILFAKPGNRSDLALSHTVCWPSVLLDEVQSIDWERGKETEEIKMAQKYQMYLVSYKISEIIP